jgi:hypothetical protein
MIHTFPVGTSEPQDFVLRDQGTAIDGTGWDVFLDIEEVDGTAVLTPPTVAWLVAASGTVRVSGTEDLPVGTYHVRFRLEDQGGAVGWAPNRMAPDTWRVVPVL